MSSPSLNSLPRSLAGSSALPPPIASTSFKISPAAVIAGGVSGLCIKLLFDSNSYGVFGGLLTGAVAQFASSRFSAAAEATAEIPISTAEITKDNFAEEVQKLCFAVGISGLDSTNKVKAIARYNKLSSAVGISSPKAVEQLKALHDYLVEGKISAPIYSALTTGLTHALLSTRAPRAELAARYEALNVAYDEQKATIPNDQVNDVRTSLQLAHILLMRQPLNTTRLPFLAQQTLSGIQNGKVPREISLDIYEKMRDVCAGVPLSQLVSQLGDAFAGFDSNMRAIHALLKPDGAVVVPASSGSTASSSRLPAPIPASATVAPRANPPAPSTLPPPIPLTTQPVPAPASSSARQRTTTATASVLSSSSSRTSTAGNSSSSVPPARQPADGSRSRATRPAGTVPTPSFVTALVATPVYEPLTPPPAPEAPPSPSVSDDDGDPTTPSVSLLPPPAPALAGRYPVLPPPKKPAAKNATVAAAPVPPLLILKDALGRPLTCVGTTSFGPSPSPRPSSSSAAPVPATRGPVPPLPAPSVTAARTAVAIPASNIAEMYAAPASATVRRRPFNPSMSSQGAPRSGAVATAAPTSPPPFLRVKTPSSSVRPASATQVPAATLSASVTASAAPVPLAAAASTPRTPAPAPTPPPVSAAPVPAPTPPASATASAPTSAAPLSLPGPIEQRSTMDRFREMLRWGSFPWKSK